MADAVAQLYEFRDHYFEHNDLDSAARKADDVEKELQKTLEVIDKCQGVCAYDMFADNNYFICINGFRWLLLGFSSK